ncbi:MAG TPA: terminase TerL endonuclease subunit [Candidatus Acidoferrum sp.]|nr:terminase TerL endonuclease subunit [Candidatus Acidoferrum sp.]
MADYTAIADLYVDDILSGRIVANKWTRAACQRQRDDMGRELDDAWPYYFSRDAANRVCAFLSRLKHVKGEKGGQCFVLEPWECFILTTIFGWLHKETDLRRYRRSFIECGKGNGKSFLSSGIAAYMLAADGEPGAEVVCAARAQDQARTVFDLTREMLRNDFELCVDYGFRVLQHTIEGPHSSIMKPVSAQSKGLAGGSFHFASADETWAHRSRDVVDELERGIDKRRNSLLSTITHADSNLSSVGYEQHVTAAQILGGDLKDERTFCIIYSAEGFDWESEDAWHAANPNLGVSVYLDTMREACERAKKNPALQTAFRAKNLCEWLGADITWIDPSKLDKCCSAGLRMEDYKYWREGEPGWVKGENVHRPFVLGIDLASRLDLASVVWMCIGYVPGDKRVHYFAWSKNYLPAETLEASPIAHYRRWAAAKQIIVHPGETIDIDAIEADILLMYRRYLGYGAVHNADGYKVKAAAFDSWQASQLSTSLGKADIQPIEFAKNAKTYSPVMDLFAALVLEGRFHLMDDVLFWAITNVVCHRDRNDNLFPNKSSDKTRKIDPAIAMLYALRAAIAEEGKYVKEDSVMDCPIRVIDCTPPPNVRYGKNAW